MEKTDSESSISFSENVFGGLVDPKSAPQHSVKDSNAAKKQIFKDCYFYINDFSLTYKEYFEACKGRCSVSVVSFRNRLIDIILKRGGGIEPSRSIYVTHFISDRPAGRHNWWIFRRMKGMPKQYHFITAKYVVECHLHSTRFPERSYLPKFLQNPAMSSAPSSNEGTPNRSQNESLSPNKSIESMRIMEIWAQALESENLEDFKSMDTGMYMNGNIMYIYFENFLVEKLIGRHVHSPSAVYACGQILSLNTEAKNIGLKKGMTIKAAKNICSHINLARYNQERVIEAGLNVVRYLKTYTSHILSPYYNEFYLQVSYQDSAELIDNPGSNVNENVCKLASKIYSQVPGQCVIGIGKNMLISKLASRKCRNLKIDSQESDYDYELSPVLSVVGLNGEAVVFENICIVIDGFKFLNNVHLSEIPGVGVLWPLLRKKGLVTCNDVRKKGSPMCLQSILGGRIGKMVYNFCFGYDYRCSNLPNKQMDFFLNKTFSSLVNLDCKRPLNESGSTDQKPHESDSDDSDTRPEAETVTKNLENVVSSNEPTPFNKPCSRHEEKALRSLLRDLLKQVTSVYSLFDRCIINYSIKYKCTLVLKIISKNEQLTELNSILDKQSLKHTIHLLYNKAKKDLGVTFSEIISVELIAKDILRVDENIKFIDNFMSPKIKSVQRLLDSCSDSREADNTTSPPIDSLIASCESMCTPTRRFNGWRLDSLPSDCDVSDNNQPSSFNNSSRSPSSILRSKSGESKRRSSNKSKEDSSVESNKRSSSRSRRPIKIPEGQKQITDYLSPSKVESVNSL